MGAVFTSTSEQLPHASQPDGDPAAGRRSSASSRSRRRCSCSPATSTFPSARSRCSRSRSSAQMAKVDHQSLAVSIVDRARGRRRLGPDERLPDQLPRLLADHRHARRLRRGARRGRQRSHTTSRSSDSATSSPISATARSLSLPVPAVIFLGLFLVGAYIWYEMPVGPPHDGDRRRQDGGARARRVGEADPARSLRLLGACGRGGRPDPDLGARRRLARRSASAWSCRC